MVGDTVSLSVTITTDIEELDNSELFMLMPNPNSGIFQLICEISQSSEISIKIIDNLGKVVYKENPQKYSGKITKEINLNNCPDGVYTFQLTVDEKVYKRMVVVQK